MGDKSLFVVAARVVREVTQHRVSIGLFSLEDVTERRLSNERCPVITLL